MQDDIEIRKCYIDSRDRLPGGSPSDFQVELPQQVNLPKNAVAYVGEFQVPHSWWSITANVNTALYLIERWEEASGAQQTRFTTVHLEPQNYDAHALATEMQTKVRAATRIPGNIVWTIVHQEATNSIKFTLAAGSTTGASFKVVPDSVLKNFAFHQAAVHAVYSGANYDVDNPQSVNELIGFHGDSVAIAGEYLALLTASIWTGLDSVWNTGHIDVRHRHSLYLHSSTLGTYSHIGPLGSRTCLRRIPVTSSLFGDIVVSESTHHLDWIDVGGQSLRTLDFQLRDGRGKIVDLQGGAGMSFSLLFSEKPF